MGIIKHTLTGEELLELLNEYNCAVNKRRKYEEIDFLEPSKNIKYFNNYINFINSIQNIDLIEVFEEHDSWFNPKSFEIDICTNLDKSIEIDINRKYSGQVIRFNIKVK